MTGVEVHLIAHRDFRSHDVCTPDDVISYRKQGRHVKQTCVYRPSFGFLAFDVFRQSRTKRIMTAALALASSDRRLRQRSSGGLALRTTSALPLPPKMPPEVNVESKASGATRRNSRVGATRLPEKKRTLPFRPFTIKGW